MAAAEGGPADAARALFYQAEWARERAAETNDRSEQAAFAAMAERAEDEARAIEWLEEVCDCGHRRAEHHKDRAECRQMDCICGTFATGGSEARSQSQTASASATPLPSARTAAHPFPACQTEGCCVGDCPSCTEIVRLRAELAETVPVTDALAAADRLGWSVRYLQEYGPATPLGLFEVRTGPHLLAREQTFPAALLAAHITSRALGPTEAGR